MASIVGNTGALSELALASFVFLGRPPPGACSLFRKHIGFDSIGWKRKKNYNYRRHKNAKRNKARAMRQLHALTPAILLLGPRHFPCSQVSNLIQNQPIHDQLLLYCLVK